MTTPFESFLVGVRAITWGHITSVIIAGVGFFSFLGWKLKGHVDRILRTESFVEKMATNDMPHTFHTLLNIDRNIARLSGGDPVDFTELDVELKAKKRF